MQARSSARLALPVARPIVFGHLSAVERYPGWMEGLQRVERRTGRASRWTFDARPRQWSVEVTVEQPHRRHGLCAEAPGIVASMEARLWEERGQTLLALERTAQGSGTSRAVAWWTDTSRLYRDLWRFRSGLVHGMSDLTKSLSGPSKTSLFSN